jgi:hypothetical protein
MKTIQLYEAKALDEIPVCPQECLVIISNTTGDKGIDNIAHYLSTPEDH